MATRDTGLPALTAVPVSSRPAAVWRRTLPSSAAVNACCCCSPASRPRAFWMLLVHLLFLTFGSHFSSFREKGVSESEDLPQLQMPTSVLITKVPFHQTRQGHERAVALPASAQEDLLGSQRGEERGRVSAGESPLSHWRPDSSQILISQDDSKFLFPGKLEEKGHRSSSSLLLHPCRHTTGVGVSWMRECGF